MMPWPLFDRFMACNRRLRLAIKRGEPTDVIVAEQHAILEQWEMGNGLHLTGCEDATPEPWQKWQNGEIVYDPDRGYHTVRQQRDPIGRWRKPTRWERFRARIKMWYRRVIGMEWME